MGDDPQKDGPPDDRAPVALGDASSEVADEAGEVDPTLDLEEVEAPSEAASSAEPAIEPAASGALEEEPSPEEPPSPEEAPGIDPSGASPSEGPTAPDEAIEGPPLTWVWPARGRMIALASAVVIALALAGAARIRRPAVVAQVSLDGGTADEAGAAGTASTAEAPAPAQVLPGPKDPVAAPSAPRVWRVASLKDDPNVTYVEASVGKRTLSGALAHAGLPTREVHRLLKAFDGKKKLDRARPKDTFAFALDKGKSRLVAFELQAGVADVWQARSSDGPDGPGSGALVVAKLELTVERRKIAVGLLVDGELHEVVRKAGLDEDVLKRLDDALDGHFELSDLRPGTRLRLVLTELRVEGVFARYAHADAVEVHPSSSAPALRVYRFSDDEGEDTNGTNGTSKKKPRHRERPPGYYDGKGRQPYHGGWRSPVPGARISSRFNPKRLHPVLHVVMPHNGIDFAAPTGAKIYAASSGTVASAGNGGPCGNMVQIEHPGGLTTAYCHMSRFAAGLHAGQHVDTRQLIGYVGATGRVTGPHLHFALKKNAQFVDPMSLKMDGVRVLPPSDRSAFAAARASLDAALDGVTLPAASVAADAGVKDEEVFEEALDDPDAGAHTDAGF